MTQAAKQLQQLLEPGVTALGYELLGIEHLAQGRHSVLRLYIDSPDGITVEDCERVSHQVSGVLEVEDPIKGQYTLEVSSPGLDRPLFKPEHYARFIGAVVSLRLARPMGVRRKFKGRLLALRDEAVVIEQDGVEVVVPLEDIDKAHLVPQW
ncbi:ribosome maturation factor RimP [Sulfurivermis fontis]|uniref:ribosome maturation factor RimP n=1 Tax=Sulfurivermis fontis TaxID=1972068 RepID=UPI000FDA5499|nr:ribosome maturation factor RimP [Sulfurivermis fontis]